MSTPIDSNTPSPSSSTTSPIAPPPGALSQAASSFTLPSGSPKTPTQSSSPETSPSGLTVSEAMKKDPAAYHQLVSNMENGIMVNMIKGQMNADSQLAMSMQNRQRAINNNTTYIPS